MCSFIVCVRIKIVVQFLTSLVGVIFRPFSNVLLTINKQPFVLPYNACFEVHSLPPVVGNPSQLHTTTTSLISGHFERGHYSGIDCIPTIVIKRKNTHELRQLRRNDHAFSSRADKSKANFTLSSLSVSRTPSRVSRPR